MIRLRSRATRVAVTAAAAALLLVGCSADEKPEAGSETLRLAGMSSAPAAETVRYERAALPVTTVGIRDGAEGLVLSPTIPVSATGGTVEATVTGPDGPVAGTLADGNWTPDAQLSFSTPYTMVVTATNPDGARSTNRISFTTLTPAQELEISMMPVDGETVGVGMPVVLYLNHSVAKDKRAEFESRLTLTPSTEVEGDWRWFSDKELHWRPKEYWPANTTVNFKTDLYGFETGNGAYGVKNRDVTFEIGDAHISVVDTDTHQMTTTINGVVAKTFPISAGQENSDPTFITRSGVHLVLSKHAEYTMDGASAGAGDYLTDVKWATRISNSGEFVHGAPWSVPSQGKRNVSHGCVNASDENAKWFHDLSLRGDVVDVRGTERPMEATNGLGDWTIPWEEWIQD